MSTPLQRSMDQAAECHRLKVELAKKDAVIAGLVVAGERAVAAQDFYRRHLIDGSCPGRKPDDKCTARRRMVEALAAWAEATLSAKKGAEG